MRASFQSHEPLPLASAQVLYSADMFEPLTERTLGRGQLAKASARSSPMSKRRTEARDFSGRPTPGTAGVATSPMKNLYVGAAGG